MIGAVYKSLWPKAFKDMTYTDILPDDVAPLTYPFVALTINTGSPDDPVVSEPHRDVLDAFYGSWQAKSYTTVRGAFSK